MNKGKTIEYIERLETEIDEYVGKELDASMLSFSVQQALHILFENRKHALALLCEEKHERTAGKGNAAGA